MRTMPLESRVRDQVTAAPNLRGHDRYDLNVGETGSGYEMPNRIPGQGSHPSHHFECTGDNHMNRLHDTPGPDVIPT